MGRREDRDSRHHRSHHRSKREIPDEEYGSGDLPLDYSRHHKEDQKKVEKSKKKRRQDLSDDSSHASERRRRNRKRMKKHRREKSDDDEESSRRHSRKKRSRRRDDRAEDDRERRKDRKSDHRREDKKKKKGEESDHKKSKSNKIAPKKPDKTSLFPMGDELGHAPETLIDAETDYFIYHQEFWVYLYREEGIRFNELQSDEAREAFGRFAKQYNAGKLEASYYDNPPSFPQQVLDESETTQHKWRFQTTETERRGLEQLQQGVRKLTEYKDEGKAEALTSQNSAKRVQNWMAPEDNEHHRQRKTPEERVEERRTNRQLRENARTADEEITGGAKDFRERQIEKRKEQAARIHGAARDKEEGTGTELDDSTVYGDGDRSFQQAIARERQSKAKKEEKRNSRVQELQQKERDRQENMLKRLGLEGVKPGEKITIAPRKDN